MPSCFARPSTFGPSWSRVGGPQGAERRSLYGVLLTLSALFGLQAGCICVVSDRTPWPGPAEIDLDRNMAECIAVASRAMLRLARG